jgi:hypothetical protein
MMAYKVLKNHPRSNGKIGLTGHSRGGTNALMVSDIKFTSLFLEGTEGFDAMIGGKHGDEYLPQFINFFKENLL